MSYFCSIDSTDFTNAVHFGTNFIYCTERIVSISHKIDAKKTIIFDCHQNSIENVSTIRYYVIQEMLNNFQTEKIERDCRDK